VFIDGVPVMCERINRRILIVGVQGIKLPTYYHREIRDGSPAYKFHCDFFGAKVILTEKPLEYRNKLFSNLGYDIVTTVNKVIDVLDADKSVAVNTYRSMASLDIDQISHDFLSSAKLIVDRSAWLGCIYVGKTDDGRLFVFEEQRTLNKYHVSLGKYIEASDKHCLSLRIYKIEISSILTNRKMDIEKINSLLVPENRLTY
jgi:hypothetical protein